MNTLVTVPTYNEADGICEQVDAVIAHAPEVEVLVVDDNSPDGTAALVVAHPTYGRRVHLLNRPAKVGVGAAYRAGFAWALSRGYHVVVQMDANLSHPPERLPTLLEALNVADIAIGSRYVPGGGVADWPLSRRVISAGGSLYVRLVLGLPTRDATAGFEAFHREALGRTGATSSQSNGYCFRVENTWRAHRLGLRVVEVPFTFRDRTRGESKMTGAIVREAMLRVLTWRWSEFANGELVHLRPRASAPTAGVRRHDTAA